MNMKFKNLLTQFLWWQCVLSARVNELCVKVSAQDLSCHPDTNFFYKDISIALAWKPSMRNQKEQIPTSNFAVTHPSQPLPKGSLYRLIYLCNQCLIGTKSKERIADTCPRYMVKTSRKRQNGAWGKQGTHLTKCSPKPTESFCRGANGRSCLSMGDLWYFMETTYERYSISSDSWWDLW